MSTIATGCPECGKPMQQTDNRYACPGCGHKGEQGVIPLPGQMRKLSLFSGIGGIDLAAEWAGMETVAFCEREPFPAKVLEKHWPGRPIYDDVRTLTRQKLEEDGIIGADRTIDLISAGYPCQPFSNAGNRLGQADDRHLWPEVARLLREIRPRWFLGENVAGHITLGLDDVLTELEDIGYDAQAFVVPASAVGAPHRRDRVFIVGYAERGGFTGESRGWAGTEPADGHSRMEEGDVADASCDLPHRNVGRNARVGQYPNSGEDVADAGSAGREKRDSTAFANQSGHSARGGYANRAKRTIKPELGRAIDGLSARLDRHRWPAGPGQPQHDWEPPRVATGVKDRVGRLKALGNAVNPLQVYPILAAIKAINDELEGLT